MRFLHLKLRFVVVACGIMLGTVAALIDWASNVVAADKPATAGYSSGTFVSFQDGKLTIRGKAGLIEFKNIDDGYKTFQNNEDGPGSKQVETVETLKRALPGTVMHIDASHREISCGLDNRVIGKFVSFTDGKLKILAANSPVGFFHEPKGTILLNIDPSTPVLESIVGRDFQYAGHASEVLKRVPKDEVIVARSEYDPNIVEVIQIGQPKRQIERYVGQSRGTVRGSFMAFEQGLLKMRGKALTDLAASEYERVIRLRIPSGIPIVESIDGGEYKPVTVETLASLKEGAIVTIRKVEEVILEVQIGVAKQD